MLRYVSFWTASARGASPAAGLALREPVGERVYGGRRERPREKSGVGKTVRALTRMLVTVSSRERCGLNWYLWKLTCSAGCQKSRIVSNRKGG